MIMPSPKTLLLRTSSPLVEERTAKILWRDLSFLVLGSLALSIVSYVETHAADMDARGSHAAALMMMDNSTNSNNNHPTGILDTGFVLTSHLHRFLEQNRTWNDRLAAINSLALVIPCIYVTYTTVWMGDFTLVFRIIATQLLRSFCGWFTYLPPDPSYLTSYYDFPAIAQCLFQDCNGEPKVLPFVSFFSGHVATLVITGNHMWLRNYSKLSICIYTINAFQIVRLLATRGHYSIDIIIGWYMAIYVSNGAGRLGRYYSRGASFQEIMPSNAVEAFETVTGVTQARNEARMSKILRRKDVQELLLKIQTSEDDSEQTDTTARIIHERVNEHVLAFQAELRRRRFNLVDEARS